MSRFSFGLLALVGLLAVSGAAPASAEAQFTVKRSEVARNTDDPAAEASRRAATERVNEIFLAQRRYFREHGRFAPELWELAELSEQPSQIISYEAGRDWYVVLAGSMEAGIVQTVVTVVQPAEAAEAAVAAGGGTDR